MDARAEALRQWVCVRVVGGISLRSRQEGAKENARLSTSATSPSLCDHGIGSISHAHNHDPFARPPVPAFLSPFPPSRRTRCEDTLTNLSTILSPSSMSLQIPAFSLIIHAEPLAHDRTIHTHLSPPAIESLSRACFSSAGHRFSSSPFATGGLQPVRHRAHLLAPGPL